MVNWKGKLSLNVPSFGLGSMTYNLRAEKAHGDQIPVKVVRVDSVTNVEVVGVEFATAPTQTTLDVTVPPSSPVPQYIKPVKHYFPKSEADAKIYEPQHEIPAERVVDKQQTPEGDLLSPFDRTDNIVVEQDGYVPIERIPEYKFKEIYQLGANTEKTVNEDPNRVLQLARFLTEKQTALVAFFSWGRGYQYYTAVVHPYERKDGKLWLLLGLAEGKLTLKDEWSLEPVTKTVSEPVIEVPLAKPKGKKPAVSISK